MKFNIDQYKAPLSKESKHNSKCKSMGSGLYCSNVRSCSYDRQFCGNASSTHRASQKKDTRVLGVLRNKKRKQRTSWHLCISPCHTCFLNRLYTLGVPSQRESKRSWKKINESSVKGRNWFRYEELLNKWGFLSLKKRLWGEGSMRGWRWREGLPTASSKTAKSEQKADIKQIKGDTFSCNTN